MTIFTITDNASASGHSGDLTITSIVFSVGNTCTIIAANAFNGCTNLTSIDFTNANSLGTIGNYSFLKCSNLNVNLIIPSTVTVIDESAFDSTKIVGLSLPSGLTTLGRYAFNSCFSLTGSVTIPPGITKLDEGVFANCYNLSNVVLPTTLYSINYFCFAYCGLTSLTLPPNLVKILNGAFYSCTKITGTLVIPESVKDLGFGGAGTFWNCSSITEIIIYAPIYYYTSGYNGTFQNCTSVVKLKIKYPIYSISDQSTFGFRPSGNHYPPLIFNNNTGQPDTYFNYGVMFNPSVQHDRGRTASCATPAPIISSTEYPNDYGCPVGQTNTKMTLTFNGTERFSPRNLKYFTRQQIFDHHTGGGGHYFTDDIAVYSFALRPEETQPSGTCNMSRLDRVQIKFTDINTVPDATETLKPLDVYAVNQNVLRIMSGMGGLAYSN